MLSLIHKSKRARAHTHTKEHPWPQHDFSFVVFFIQCTFISSVLMSLIPLQRTTQTSMPPAGLFFSSVDLSLYFIHACFFVLIVLAFFSFLSLLTNTTQTSMPSAGFEPAIPVRPVATDLRPWPHGQRDREEIRTRDLSNQATIDLSLRLDGHRRRQDSCSLLLSFGIMTECYSSDTQLHGKKDNHLLHFKFQHFRP